MQKISPEELDDIAASCEYLDNIYYVYEEIKERYPESSGEELRDLFLWSIEEFMKQGRLRFLDENYIRSGTEPDSPWLFGDNPSFSQDDIVVQLSEPSPEDVVELIRSKWPPELVPLMPLRREGFSTTWFYKWEFEWLDKDGNPVEF